jgi:hypothetical protein
MLRKAAKAMPNVEQARADIDRRRQSRGVLIAISVAGGSRATRAPKARGATSISSQRILRSTLVGALLLSAPLRPNCRTKDICGPSDREAVRGRARSAC